MGDGVSDFSPSFGGWGVGVLSPTGSAGQMDALCQGIRADALIWADGLAQQPTPAKGHLEKHKKGAGEKEEEEEEEMPSSSLATLAHLPKASATLARAEAEVVKPATSLLPSQGWDRVPIPTAACLEGADPKVKKKLQRSRFNWRVSKGKSLKADLSSRGALLKVNPSALGCGC